MKQKDFFKGASPSLIKEYKKMGRKQAYKRLKRNKQVDKYILAQCINGFID